MDLIEKSDSKSRHPWELARFEVVNDIVNQEIANFRDKNILDLGCGDLFFLTKFAESKPEANFYAVDTAFDDEFINQGKHQKINVFKSLEDLPKENLIFDVIFLMDVIEHIKKDFGFLRDLVLSDLVDGRTIFVITVPAFQGLFSSHDYFLKHFRRYNNRSIEELTRKSSLQTIEKGYFFFSLLLPRFAEVIVEKIKGRKNLRQGTDLTNWSSTSLVSKAIKNILLLDYKVQKLIKRTGVRLPGLSNYIVCKKSV